MTVVVVMGVSGIGKTTFGRRLADRLGWGFAEGDSYHPPGNITKMRSGTPLVDADRWPWLAAIAADIETWLADGTDMVVACSALKRRYRDILVGGRPDVHLVQLEAEEPLLRARVEARSHQYMPPSLLASQIATLEPPDADERAIVIDVARDPGQCVGAAVDALRDRLS